VSLRGSEATEAISSKQETASQRALAVTWIIREAHMYIWLILNIAAYHLGQIGLIAGVIGQYG
jgi:hypothetical protein